jgi:hypothetical protein
MAQLSRPFQIALVAVGLLACVWFVALRGHSSSSGGSGSSAPEAAHTTSLPTAPGVAGLAKDVEKARGAAKTSEQNAAALEQKSAAASSASATAAAGQAAAGAPTAGHSASTPAQTAHSAAAGKAAAKHAGPASRQKSVEAQLAHGDVVLLLFWNPKGISDRSVRQQVRGASGRSVAVQEATASEAAAFGSITRGVQIYSTPTVLVVNRKGEAHVVTGFTDTYALRQVIAEARKG